jgi:predicted DNA-binding protein (UPF0251 family)/predicted Fe-Mo cluster-binding NifX family protein
MNDRRGRPHRCRAIDFDPEVRRFKPAGVPSSRLEQVVLTLDELEALRLADAEGLYHAAAADLMHISRQTFGRILASARKTVAEALIHGREIIVDGGTVVQKNKRITPMTIAIASDDGTHVAQHFGRTRGFVMFSESDGKEETRYVANTFTQHTQGQQHGEQHSDEGGRHQHSHANILQALEGCAMVVAGGMGTRLREDLRSAGIQAILTDHTLVADVVGEARTGKLVHIADRRCGH